MVTVSGVKVTLKPSFFPEEFYMGTFPVATVPASDRFTYAMLFPPSESPAPGNIRCWKERERFDVLMRSMPANTTIHLGPGVFETKGYGGYVTGSWSPRSGQRFIGSGMYVTTLRIVGASSPYRQHVVFGTVNNQEDNASTSQYLDGFEARDFTVDCQLEFQPSSNTVTAAMALSAGGRHVRVRRVRAIGFGSRAPADYYIENFVFAINVPTYDTPENLIAQSRDTHDCLFEDCVAEQPTPNPIWNSSIFLLGGGEARDESFAYFARGCAIRNCFVNGEIIYGTPTPLPVQNITYEQATGIVTVTAKLPHLLTKPGNVVMRGVTAGGTANNRFNGCLEVLAVDSPTVFKYRVFSATGPNAGNGFVGGGVSSHKDSIASIKEDETPYLCPALALHLFEIYEDRFVITTRDPHFRTSNNNVRVTGVSTTVVELSAAAFNGEFPVEDYEPSAPNELKYTLTQPLVGVNASQLDINTGSVNVGHIAMTADGGTGAVVEGNRIFHCSTAVFHDTFASKDLIVRNNYFHDVLAGPFQNLSGVAISNYAGVGITIDKDPSDNTVAIATTPRPHGFHFNDRVTIYPGANADPLYAGQDPPPVVTAVPSATTFKYRMNSRKDR